MNTAPTTYAIRVNGHLDDHWSAWLGELEMTREDDGTTTVAVSIADQAQLHGVLARLCDIGAVITELRTADAPVPSCRPTATASCFRSLPVSRPPSSSPSDTTPRPRSSATSCSAARTPGPNSMSQTKPTTRRRSSAGSSIPSTPATATPPKPCMSYSATASKTSACAGSPRTASCITTPLAASWSASACAANCMQSASRCHRAGQWLDTVGYAILKEESSPTRRVAL